MGNKFDNDIPQLFIAASIKLRLPYILYIFIDHEKYVIRKLDPSLLYVPWRNGGNDEIYFGEEIKILKRTSMKLYLDFKTI